MLVDTDREIADALARAASDAFTHGWTSDEITQMVTAQQPRTLDNAARRMAEDSESEELPVYAEAPPGMIDVATAVRVHGINQRTVHHWVSRGLLPVMGKIRGLGGTRVLVCEETVAKMAKQPKNKGGRPRKIQISY